VGRPLGVPRDGHLAPARGDLDAERVLEKPQVFVVDTEERAEPGLGEGERNGVGSDVVRASGGDSSKSEKTRSTREMPQQRVRACKVSSKGE